MAMIKSYKNNPRTISARQLQDLRKWMRELGDVSGIVHDLNSNQIVGGNQRSRVININKCKITIEHEYPKPDSQGTVRQGYVIWQGHKYNYRAVRWTKAQCDRANLIANKAGGQWNYAVLGANYSQDLLQEIHFDNSYVKELRSGLAGMADLRPKKDDKPKAHGGGSGQGGKSKAGSKKPAKHLTHRDLYRGMVSALKQEIDYCKNHRGIKDKRYETGFMAGLKQALLLIKAAARQVG